MKMLVQPGVRSSDHITVLQSHLQTIGTQINLNPILNLIMATIKNILWFYQTVMFRRHFLQQIIFIFLFLKKVKSKI